MSVDDNVFVPKVQNKNEALICFPRVSGSSEVKSNEGAGEESLSLFHLGLRVVFLFFPKGFTSLQFSALGTWV